MIYVYGATHKLDVTTVAFSPDGTKLLSAAKDSTLNLWNLSKRKRFFKMKLWKDWIFTCAYSPCGTYISAGCNNGGVKIIRIVDRKVIKDMKPHSHYVNAVMWSHDQVFFASASFDRKLILYDVSQNYMVLKEWVVSSFYMVRTCAFSRDNKIIMSGDYDGYITGFNTFGDYNIAFKINYFSTNDGKLFFLII